MSVLTSYAETLELVFRISIYTIAFVGVQFAWQTELTLTTPYFSSELKASSTLNHLVWAFGPISGFVVQPIVGVYSDSCESRLGRRRPFIIIGLISSVLAMAVFSNSEQIGKLFTSSHYGGIVIGYISFLFMDLSINTIQGPLRALVSDLLLPEHQNMGQSIATLMQAAGACLSGIVIYNLESPSTSPDIEYVFVAAMVLMTLTTLTTIIFSKEEQFVVKEKGSFIQPFIDIAKGITKMKREMVRLCVVQFVIWLSWFTFLPTSSNWMGEVVFHGASSNDTNYQNGVKFTAFAGIFQAICQLVTSLIVPTLVQYFGMRIVYFGSYVVQGLCFLTIGFTKDKWVGFTCLVLAGIPFATTNIFPFALVGDYYKEEASLGVNMGILNWFIVLPQLLDTTWTGYVSGHRAHDTFLQADGCNIFIGGIFALVAAVLTWIIILPSFLQFSWERLKGNQPQTNDESMQLMGGAGH